VLFETATVVAIVAELRRDGLQRECGWDDTCEKSRRLRAAGALVRWGRVESLNTVFGVGSKVSTSAQLQNQCGFPAVHTGKHLYPQSR
jgi:hypothetical protein